MILSASAGLPTVPDTVTMPSLVWMLMPPARVGRFVRTAVRAWLVMEGSVLLLPPVSRELVAGLPPGFVGRGDPAGFSDSACRGAGARAVGDEWADGFACGGRSSLAGLDCIGRGDAAGFSGCVFWGAGAGVVGED